MQILERQGQCCGEFGANRSQNQIDSVAEIFSRARAGAIQGDSELVLCGHKARGGMPGVEDREAFRQASKERIAEYGVTWGLLIGYDENGRLSEEAYGYVEQLRSLCAKDPDATLEHLMDSLE